MDLQAVMQQISDRLTTISGLRCFAYPPDNFEPPAAILVAPDSVTFDATYGRGSDELALPVLLLISKVDDRSAWKEIAAYCNGTGPKSVKAVVESGTYTAFGLVRVADIEFDVVTWTGVDYLSAKFNLDIDGPGSP